MDVGNPKPFDAKLLAIVIVSLLAVIGVAGTGFALSKLAKVNRALTQLQGEKAKVAEELAALKATDLAKEVIRLTAFEKEVGLLRARNEVLERNARQLQPYFEAVSAVQGGFYGGNLESSFPGIDRAMAALGEPDLLAKWQDTKRVVQADLADGSWSPAPIGDLLDVLLSRIRTLL